MCRLVRLPYGWNGLSLSSSPPLELLWKLAVRDLSAVRVMVRSAWVYESLHPVKV